MDGRLSTAQQLSTIAFRLVPPSVMTRSGLVLAVDAESNSRGRSSPDREARN